MDFRIVSSKSEGVVCVLHTAMSTALPVPARSSTDYLTHDMDSNVITDEGYADLENELDVLWRKERPASIKIVQMPR